MQNLSIYGNPIILICLKRWIFFFILSKHLLGLEKKCKNPWNLRKAQFFIFHFFFLFCYCLIAFVEIIACQGWWRLIKQSEKVMIDGLRQSTTKPSMWFKELWLYTREFFSFFHYCFVFIVECLLGLLWSGYWVLWIRGLEFNLILIFL